MGILGRLRGKHTGDPYWEAFINRPMVAPNGITSSLLEAPAGKIFPVKTDIPSPAIMARDLMELATFLGAASMGVTQTDAAILAPTADDSADASVAPEQLASDYPHVIVCTVAAESDPAVALGHGGQFPIQQLESVLFTVAAYVRELGYRAVICGIDSPAAAVAAGLGSLDGSGRLTTKEHGSQVYVGRGLLTDIPLVPGRPVR